MAESKMFINVAYKQEMMLLQKIAGQQQWPNGQCYFAASSELWLSYACL